VHILQSIGGDWARPAAVLDLLACAVAVALAADGWHLERLPGEPMRLTRGDDELRPGVALGEILDEDGDVGAWEATCRRLGIADLPLATPAEDGPVAGAPPATEAPGQSVAGTAR
jgi:hypothetical protein